VRSRVQRSRSQTQTQTHGNVDVFENLPRSNAENSVDGLDQIIALSPAVLPSEVIGEAKVRAELFGLD